MTSKKFSLVSTVLNDLSGAKNLIEDLKAQTRFPTEFVILDGGSKDGTFEYLQSLCGLLPFDLIVLVEEKAKVSRGRNIAILHSTYDIILTTDFGCRLDSHWCEELMKPFEEDDSTEIVTGSWSIKSEEMISPFQLAEMALAGGKMEFIATKTCLASTRSLAYKKFVWEEFGRYPEDLSLAGDDALFSIWMVQAGKKIKAAPKAMCYWHRFTKLKYYLKEARRNFKGCGEALFWMNYGVLVGGFLVAELLLVTLFLISLIFAQYYLALTFVLLFLMFFLRRCFRWLKSIFWMIDNGHITKIWAVPVFDYLTKIWGVYGFWEGFFRGYKHCQKCRVQMRKLGIGVW